MTNRITPGTSQTDSLDSPASAQKAQVQAWEKRRKPRTSRYCLLPRSKATPLGSLMDVEPEGRNAPAEVLDVALVFMPGGAETVRDAQTVLVLVAEDIHAPRHLPSSPLLW
jgi:hypothetical protein